MRIQLCIIIVSLRTAYLPLSSLNNVCSVKSVPLSDFILIKDNLFRILLPQLCCQFCITCSLTRAALGIDRHFFLSHARYQARPRNFLHFTTLGLNFNKDLPDNEYRGFVASHYHCSPHTLGLQVRKAEAICFMCLQVVKNRACENVYKLLFAVLATSVLPEFTGTYGTPEKMQQK